MLNSKFEQVEERIGKSEDMSIEISSQRKGMKN